MDELFEFRDLADIDLNINVSGEFESRYISPPKCFEIPERFLKYRNAEKLAKDISITKNSRHFVFVDGSFHFGDFIEALIVVKNYHVKKLNIQTLSMSQNNVDSLANLLRGGFVDELNLIVSDYFYSHERQLLVNYIYDELDRDNKFQLAVASSHCKIATIETHNGGKILIHGSANLRSSSNIEQIMIEENETLFNFVDEVNISILEKYKTINKSLRRSKLWQVVQESGQQETQ